MDPRRTDEVVRSTFKPGALHAYTWSMDYVWGILLAFALMVILRVPFFFFEIRAGKVVRRGKLRGKPIGSGDIPPRPPLDKVSLR